MTLTALPAAIFVATSVFAAPPAPAVYTNEEQVYFDREAGRTPPPWMGLDVDAAGALRPVDAFGDPVSGPAPAIVASTPDTLTARLADGATTTLNRARPATCWVAVLKDARKADGSEDWHFQRGLVLHDQGGRVRAGGGDSGARAVTIRMRNVVWASGPNRPSLVLYIHDPDAPDRALSYAWADPGATRIGVNLRWMQASCTIDGSKEPQASSKGETE
jgi:hypothetical protein